MVKKKNKTTKLTAREKKFIEALAEGHTVIEAGRLAGYSESTLSSQIYKNAEKSRIKQAVEDIRERNRTAFERAGLSHEARIKKIIELTECKKTVATARCDGRGNIEFVVPEHRAQLGAIKIACNLCGDYPAKCVGGGNER